MESKDCSVCVETLNKSNRKAVTCPFCQYTACKSCAQQYLLSQIVLQASCMNCSKAWDHFLLVQLFGSTWTNGVFTDHIATLLYDRERTTIQKVQLSLEINREKEKIQKRINELYKEIHRLNQEVNVLSQRKERETSNFSFRCVNEDCRGFLKNNKCDLCDTIVCKDCFEEKDSEHKCDANSLESAKLIRKDSKPCPGCGMMIFKTEGCDQIYCTQCHFAFSWKTGRKETVIHNPHYFEYMRKIGLDTRNPGEIQCGQELNHFMIIQLTNNMNPLLEILRQVIHIREIIIPGLRRQPNNEDLAYNYLLKKIDETQYKSCIRRRSRLRSRDTELYQILSMYVTTVTDICYRYYEWNSTENYISLFNEIQKLREYVNECLARVAIAYKMKTYTIDDF